MQTKLHEAREKKWVISRDCFLVSHLIGREVMEKKRTHCYPGFDTQGKILSRTKPMRTQNCHMQSPLCAGKRE